MVNLGLSLTCQEVYDALLRDPADCQTRNELTRYPPRLSGNHRRNWRLVSDCLADLEERGLVQSDEKCPKKAKCFKLNKQNSLIEDTYPTTVDEVGLESDAQTSKLFIPRLERSSDFYRELGGRSQSNPIRLRTFEGPV